MLPEKKKDEKFRTVIHVHTDLPLTSYSIDSAFGRAVFRGFADQINEAAEMLTSVFKYANVKISKTETPDIYEMKFENSWTAVNGKHAVDAVLEKYPALKMAAFFEEESWFEANGYIAFSEPGYGFVTEIEYVDLMDKKSDWNFVWDNDPLSDFDERGYFLQTGESFSIHYRFPFGEKWRKFDYLRQTEQGFEAVKGIVLSEDVD